MFCCQLSYDLEADIPHQRNLYFTVLNLVGDGIFCFVGDYHHQHDGIIEVAAARFDNMIEKIRSAAEY